ncbi:hypothetical protein Zm00014a_027723 [Zea mays]|uniref:Scarecrow-like transcription factor 11 (SCL11) n=2 Tax=Zea mays TaxID=4577 RepID=C4JAJ6_MAIZE|nr:uncharacterized protein LOC100277744 [Zea mays]ACR38196.1 unknown [Zea mays]ONM30073.1 scarecrow-like transcription factor 11 (SCL11) [Zea mays]PWZ31583.1 hypothetical protein Zm00014a_027723 [Zea mays]|eukprot:NP_001144708.2 uncharacterized LOC100277744 [Zea mays]
MAAKREISSTLRNLKFMQRGAAAQKAEEKAEVEVQEEEVVMAPSGGFASSAQVVRKCIVIMEGNPHPGAIKGRMSFQNFNPSIDKLNEEARGDQQTESASPSNCDQDNANSSRGNEVPASRCRDFGIPSSESISLNELKRKEPDLDMETPASYKEPKTNVGGRSSSQSNGRGSHKSNKREKLDFNHLRPKK